MMASKESAATNSKLQSLLDQLKQLETEKKRLYVEFEKRRKQRETNQRAIEAEKNRTEKRLTRLNRIVAALDRAVTRVKRIIQRLKLIQKQQELLTNEILLKLEGRSSAPIKLLSSANLPRIAKQAKTHTTNKPYPAMPGRRNSKPTPLVEQTSAIESLTPQQAIEAKTVLLSILQDIQSFKEKRQEIENEVDRLKQL